MTESVKYKDRLLMIFVKNPEIGKVKTRLADTIGDEKALEIYRSLLTHTREISEDVQAQKAVFYHEYITVDDLWAHDDYEKFLQHGESLGDKMSQAFESAFDAGYKQVVIIGSDCLEINAEIISHAFHVLESKDAVVGPASDGGYYLLGMKKLHDSLFRDKRWSEEDVLLDTVIDLKKADLDYELLDTLSDIDVASDLESVDY